MEGRPHFSFFWGGVNLEQVLGLQKMWRGDRAFFLNLEQVLGRAYRKCGRSTALFFFFCGLNLEQVLAYRNCGGATALFFFFGWSEPGTVLAYRKCGEGIALFFSFCGLNLEQVLAELTENVERE